MVLEPLPQFPSSQEWRAMGAPGREAFWRHCDAVKRRNARWLVVSGCILLATYLAIALAGLLVMLGWAGA